MVRVTVIRLKAILCLFRVVFGLDGFGGGLDGFADGGAGGRHATGGSYEANTPHIALCARRFNRAFRGPRSLPVARLDDPVDEVVHDLIALA